MLKKNPMYLMEVSTPVEEATNIFTSILNIKLKSKIVKGVEQEDAKKPRDVYTFSLHFHTDSLVGLQSMRTNAAVPPAFHWTWYQHMILPSNSLTLAILLNFNTEALEVPVTYCLYSEKM